MKLSKRTCFLLVFSFLLLVSCDSAEKNNLPPPTDTEKDGVGDSDKSESEFDQYQEMVEDGLELVEEISEEIKDNKASKDSVYEANRDHKWVYQISTPADDPEHLRSSFEKYNELEETFVFQTNDNHYFLFIMDGRSEFDLIADLDLMKDSLGTNLVSVIDLVADCSRKQHLVQTDPVEIGKRRNKITIPCYTCNK